MLRLGNATTRIAITSVTVAGSLFIGAQDAAQAGGVMKDFREFRHSNPGMDRGALRQLFKQSLANPGGQGNPNPVPGPITILPVFPDRGPISTPRNDNQVTSLRLESVQSASEDKSKKTFQFGEGGIKISGADGIDMDLTSDRKNITVGSKLFGDQTVQVNAGGEQVTVGAGSVVTAAEYVAAKQVLLTGSQNLELNQGGAAVGGKLNLSEITSKSDKIRIDDLSIPGRVSAYGDFSRGSTFEIQGDLVNSGSIYTLVVTNDFKNAAFEAENIVNGAGAVFSSRAPIVGVEGANDGASRYEVNLTLRANDAIENHGTITSSGDLELSSVKSITNTNKLTAHRQVKLEAPNITNSGLVESYTRSITLETAVPATLDVTNTGGTMKALNGAINVRGVSFTGTFNTTVTGGDLLSKEVNINAGRGEANLTVDTLTGVINENGNVTHSVANTQSSPRFSSYSAGTLLWAPDSVSINDTFARVGDAVLSPGNSLFTATGSARVGAQFPDQTANVQPAGTADSTQNAELGVTINTVDLQSSFNSSQSTVDLLTAQSVVRSASENLESMIDMDEDEFYSVGYDGTEYGGSICTDLVLYNAITDGSAAKVPHVLLSERVNRLRGRSLLLPNQDTSIGTEFGDVKIKAGAIVLFSASDDGIAIYNIHDNGKNSVSLEAGGKQIALAPGRHISITRDKAADFATINHVESISHRGLQSVSLNDELIAYLSDFSPLSAMANIHPVKTIMKSSHPESKKLASKLIKTSAVLMHIAGPGSFKFFPKPRMTASLLTEQQL